MNAAPADELTLLLADLGRGVPRAHQRLPAAAYEELRRIAHAAMRRERPDHTLDPTSLVHEAWVRLVGDAPRSFDSRAHFFHAAANEIRRILIEHARRRLRCKRRADRRVAVDPAALPVPDADQNLLALDEALHDLNRLDPERARLVQLRFFAGLSTAETAAMLGVSESTVARDWRVARAFLRGRLDPVGG